MSAPSEFVVPHKWAGTCMGISLSSGFHHVRS
jgi:hypothetical protein